VIVDRRQVDSRSLANLSDGRRAKAFLGEHHPGRFEQSQFGVVDVGHELGWEPAAKGVKQLFETIVLQPRREIKKKTERAPLCLPANRGLQGDVLRRIATGIESAAVRSFFRASILPASSRRH
jgi:hypothetical protein